MTVPSGWSFGKTSEAVEKPDHRINPIEKKNEEMKKGEDAAALESDKYEKMFVGHSGWVGYKWVKFPLRQI